MYEEKKLDEFINVFVYEKKEILSSWENYVYFVYDILGSVATTTATMRLYIDCDMHICCWRERVKCSETSDLQKKVNISNASNINDMPAFIESICLHVCVLHSIRYEISQQNSILMRIILCVFTFLFRLFQ